jgi:hypothetical protein
VGQGQSIQTTRRNGAFLRAWADVSGVCGARPALDDCVERDDEIELDDCVERDDEIENASLFKIILSQARKGEIRRDVAVERMAASDQRGPLAPQIRDGLDARVLGGGK